MDGLRSEHCAAIDALNSTLELNSANHLAEVHAMTALHASSIATLSAQHSDSLESAAKEYEAAANAVATHHNTSITT